VTQLLHRRRFVASLLCAFGLVAGSGIVLSGCSQTEPSPDSGSSGTAPKSPASPGAVTPGTLKVGLITPGKVTDGGWNQSASDGLNKIKVELKAETTPPVEGPAMAQVESSMRDLATQGATLVFGHASEYDDPAKNVSKDFPQTYFVVMGGKTAGSNLVPIQLQSQQATYLAGMLAAGMSKTGKIGLVGGIELPIIKQAFVAFEKGAKAVKPSIQVTTTFTGSFDDTAKAKQQTEALLQSGADVIMHNANDAGAGVFQAVEAKSDALVIGANADQSKFATAQNLGSFILDVPAAMAEVAKKIKEGRTDGKPFAAGLKEKAVGFVYNPGFKGAIPADLKAKIKKAEDDMIAGKLDPSK
jgi:basic membrane protein A and related proteins